MLRLYDFGPSASCLKVRILLAHLGQRYERVAADLFEPYPPNALAGAGTGSMPHPAPTS